MTALAATDAVADQVELRRRFLSALDRICPNHEVNLWMLFDVLAYASNDFAFVPLTSEHRVRDIQNWARTLKDEFYEFGHMREEGLTVFNLMKVQKLAGVTLTQGDGRCLATHAASRVIWE